MLGVYNYTVILTYIGMLSGFYGILFTFNGDLRRALLCLLIAGVCDMFDGKIAATRERTRSEQRFGIQIDSLSDLVCFGVLPALIVYSLSAGILRTVLCALYVLSALIRLAWFNVDEEARQDWDTGRRKVYLGLPVTSAAVVFPLLVWAGWRFHWPLPFLAPLVLGLMTVAFLLPVPVRKPSLSVRRKPMLHGRRRKRRRRES